MARINMKNATPRDRFLRLASLRTSRAITAIESLGRCSNPDQYEYSADEVDEMFDALAVEIDKARHRFLVAESGENGGSRFAFSSVKA